jgi:diadenosine tetraphosphate (Ap4A) HIT family hydrolase
MSEYGSGERMTPYGDIMADSAGPGSAEMPTEATLERCAFCELMTPDTTEAPVDRIVRMIVDTNPVTPGHHLVVPVRHVTDYFEMNEREVREAHRMLRELRERLRNDDPSIAGFNIGMNCGPAAGQTIFHAHIHLIPRRFGDTPDPRGGVRGVIPGMMSY